MKSKKISRREFIDLSIKGSAGIGLSQALGASLLAATGISPVHTVHGACYHDCPDTCSWTVTAVHEKITKFEASKSNPYTAGKLCSKMDNFPDDVTFHPDRILTPLKRIGKKGKAAFEPVSWKQASSEIAGRLKSIIDEKGGEAVLPYSYAGTEGLVQKDLISGRFFAHIGATKLERTICGDAAVAGVMAANGEQTYIYGRDYF